jgi:hypothetical protein
VKALRLIVRASDELVLDAGTVETVPEGDGQIAERVLRAPHLGALDLA